MSGKTNAGVFNPKNLSLYTYTYNNPVNMVDPDGNEVISYNTAWSKPFGSLNSSQRDAGINRHYKFRTTPYGADPKAFDMVNKLGVADRIDQSINTNSAKNGMGAVRKSYEQSLKTGKAVSFKLRTQGSRMPWYKNGKLLGRVGFDISGKVTALKDGKYKADTGVSFKNDLYDWGYDDKDSKMGTAAIYIGRKLYSTDPFNRTETNPDTGEKTMPIEYNRKAQVQVYGKIDK